MGQDTLEYYDAEIVEWKVVNRLVYGTVINDKKKRFKDFDWIITSTLLEDQEPKENSVVKTGNSSYLLKNKHEQAESK